MASAALLFGANTYAQNSYDQCGHNAAVDYNESVNPGYKQKVSDQYQDLLSRIKQNDGQRVGSVYTVPVVFHVVWNSSSPEQNLHDSVLLEQIVVLNEDYSRTNADTSVTRAVFDSIVSSADIQFVLACIDPNGNSTDGIVRVETAETFGGGFFPDMADISRIQHDSSGGSDAWDPTSYFNIWIGDINGGGTPSLLGIATPPPNLPNWPAGSTPAELTDGAIIQYNAFSRNNPNTLDVGGGPIVVNGRTVTHEAGHYLGVRHTAENTFGGILGSICGDDDGLDDTPNCDQSQQGCDHTRNSCTDNIGSFGDLPDMVENYMDYSDADCQNSFTLGQTAIMRSVLENERATLLTSNGLSGCSTSVIENNPLEAIELYPNPNNGLFNIVGNKIETIEVYNGLGQLVESYNKNVRQISIDKEGVYFVKMTSGNNSIVKKVIVQ